MERDRKKIIIVGGGPAGLMAAETLSFTHNVSIYDQEKNVGQKFLLAGKGGFNLTNRLQGKDLTSKYLPEGFMNQALSDFDTLSFRQWLATLGIATFAGSSGRVFPEKDIRPIDVLNKIKARLIKQDVQFHTQHEFVGFDNDRKIFFKTQGKTFAIEADYILFALGGASWSITGSTGTWRPIFEAMGIVTHPFQSSNCGVNINWPDAVKQSHAGKPIKNIKLYTDDDEAIGEAIITTYGMEGNAVYPLIPAIRNKLNLKLPTCLYIDFKPSNTEEQLLQKMQGKNYKPKDYGKLLNLSTVQLAIIKAYTIKDEYLSASKFIHSLKKLTIPVDSLRDIEEAISTVGGIRLDEVNDDFSLKKYPWIFTIGEMLDWDAPTGGFLLQGCFSMGHFAAISILKNNNHLHAGV